LFIGSVVVFVLVFLLVVVVQYSVLVYGEQLWMLALVLWLIVLFGVVVDDYWFLV